VLPALATLLATIRPSRPVLALTIAPQRAIFGARTLTLTLTQHLPLHIVPAGDTTLTDIGLHTAPARYCGLKSRLHLSDSTQLFYFDPKAAHISALVV
jgi:hypothetical protein